MTALPFKMIFRCLAILLACLALAGTPLGGAQADDWDERVSPENSRDSASESGSRGGGARAGSSESQDYEFTLPYLEGNGSLSFKELAESGKPFVLVWWLSECPACHLQLPYVQKLEKLVEDGEADVRVITINIDQGDEDCRRYIKEKGVSFEVLHDERCRRTDRQFKVHDKGTPVTYVFKPGGELVDHMTGYTNDFPSKVLRMLDLPVPDGA